MKYLTVLSLAVVVVVLPACGHTTHLLSPQQPTPTVAPALGNAMQVLAIEDVQVIQNGQAGNVDPGFVQRFALELRRSGLFRAVYDPLNTQNAPEDAVFMKLYVTEMLDRQWGEKVSKDILVGLSYLALMPVMPYQMEYHVSLRATVIIPGMSPMEFESSTQAQVDYKGFSDMQEAEADLKRTAMNDCLNGLLVKLQANKDLVSALGRE
jgi:hypothetical protein